MPIFGFFSSFFMSELTFFISELNKKGHEPSRAELKILQLELWLEPARLGLITIILLCWLAIGYLTG